MSRAVSGAESRAETPAVAGPSIPGTLLVVGLAVAITLGLTAWWTLARERARIDGNLAAEADRNAAIAQLLLRRHVERGQALLGAVAGSAAVQDALVQNNRAAVQAALAPLRAEFGSVLLVVNDLEDRPLAFSSPLAVFGVGITGRLADPGGATPRLARAAGDLAVFDARRIIAEGTPIGEVRGAILVGRVFLREASSDLGVPLALFFNGEPAHVTFATDPPAPPASPASPGPTDAPALATPTSARESVQQSVRLGSENWQVAYRPIDAYGGNAWIAAGVSRAAADAAWRRSASAVAASSGAALLAVLLAVGIFLGVRGRETRLILQRDAERERSLGLSDRLQNLTAVVHDIKAPIGGVQLRCEGLLEEPQEPEVAAALSSIVDTCERVNLYLVNVLTAAQAEEGPITRTREVVLLPGLIEEVAERVAPLAERRRLTLVREAGDDLPPITGDPVLLERALLNMASNAVAATPPGGRVALFARRANDAVQLGTWDTGPGFTAFPPDEAFSRERPRVKDASLRTSSGLGLFIVGRIAEAHGGRALARNRSAGGAEVAIEIPLA